MTGQSRFADWMNSNDTLLWIIEKDPMLRSTMTAVFMLDQPPEEKAFMESVDRASRLIPRFRQHVVTNRYGPPRPRWELDQTFDLSYHAQIVRLDGDGSSPQGPPVGGSMRDVLDRTQELCTEDFDRAKPLWRFESVVGLADGRGALLIKMHHAITDALGFLNLAEHIFDLERDGWAARGPMPEEPVSEIGAPDERPAGRRSRNPAKALKNARVLLRSLRRTYSSGMDPLSPLTKGRSVGRRFDAFDVDFDELKTAAKAAGGKFNDAFCAATAGGLARYHEHHGAAVPAVRMQMPVNMRTEDTAGDIGNQLALARLVLPLKILDPAERIRAINALVAEVRADPGLRVFGTITTILTRLGANVAASALRTMTRGIDVMTSCVAGIPFEHYFAGSRVVAEYAYTPLAGAPISIALGTFAGRAHAGIASDPAAVPDPEFLVDCLREGFGEVCAVAR